MAFGNVILLLAVAFLASRFVLPPVFRSVARLPELVLVGALAWCLAMAGFAGLARPVHRDGRAHRRRDGLHVSLHARRGRQGHEHPRFFCDAVFCRPRHDHSRADVGLIVLWTIFFCLFLDRQPARHGFSRRCIPCGRAIASACCPPSTFAR